MAVFLICRACILNGVPLTLNSLFRASQGGGGGRALSPARRITAAAAAAHQAEQALLSAIPLHQRLVSRLRKDLSLTLLRHNGAWWQDVRGLMTQAARMRFVLLCRSVLRAWHRWTRWAKALGIELIGRNRIRYVRCPREGTDTLRCNRLLNDSTRLTYRVPGARFLFA